MVLAEEEEVLASVVINTPLACPHLVRRSFFLHFHLFLSRARSSLLAKRKGPFYVLIAYPYPLCAGICSAAYLAPLSPLIHIAPSEPLFPIAKWLRLALLVGPPN